MAIACFFVPDLVKGQMKQENRWVHVQETLGQVGLKGITSTGQGFCSLTVKDMNFRVVVCREQVYPWAPPHTKEQRGYFLSEN